MPDPASDPGMGPMLWRLAPMIYGPTVLFALGEGAVVPLIPVIAAQLGANVPTAALVASALVVGQLCGNIPAGWAVSRIGERMTMIIGGVLALGGVAGMLFAPSLPVLAAARYALMATSGSASATTGSRCGTWEGSPIFDSTWAA